MSHREEGESPPSDPTTASTRDAVCGALALHAGWAVPASIISASICRTVPQAGFATLQDDIAENLLEDHGQCLYVVIRLTAFSRLAYTRYSAVLAQPLHTE